MRLTVNGEPRTFGNIAHVADLVISLGLDPRKVAVERLDHEELHALEAGSLHGGDDGADHAGELHRPSPGSAR